MAEDQPAGRPRSVGRRVCGSTVLTTPRMVPDIFMSDQEENEWENLDGNTEDGKAVFGGGDESQPAS